MKNLLDAEDNKKMTSRISKLAVDQKRNFGTMTVEEMLYHSNTVSQAILTGGSTRKPRLKQIMLRIVVLNLMQKMPMGRHSSRKYFSGDGVLEFDTEKIRLIQTTSEFLSNTKLLTGEHPIFGRLTHRQWGRFAWIHLDHHLRQFGV
jgi:hypothetical protein